MSKSYLILFFFLFLSISFVGNLRALIAKQMLTT